MDEREKRQKGEEVEKKFMSWLNKHNILFCYITQDLNTYSNTFKLRGMKRPDFMIFSENKEPIFIDAQYNKPTKKYDAFHINFDETQSYFKLENVSGIKVWLVFGNELYHYTIWHWIPIEKVVQHKRYSSANGKGSYYSVPLEEFRVIKDKDDLNKTMQSGKKPKTYTFQEIRQVYPKAYEKWSEEDDRLLRDEYRKGKKVGELGELFQRKTSAIRSRLIKLGLIKE